MIAAGVIACLGAGVADAAQVYGDEVVSRNGSSISFLFDIDVAPIQNGVDIVGTGDGIVFEDAVSGLTITVTSTSGNVRQDLYPLNGGIGVDGGTSDNWESGEVLLLSFNRTVNIDGILFNGTFASDGHTDAADGFVFYAGPGFNTFFFDGVGTEAGNQGNICGAVSQANLPYAPSLCGITSFVMTADSTFSGYLEGISVTIVPLPASLGFLLAGVAALGVAGRGRRA